MEKSDLAPLKLLAMIPYLKVHFFPGGGGYDQISRVTAVYTSASMFVSLHGTRWRRLFFVGKRRLQARLLLK